MTGEHGRGRGRADSGARDRQPSLRGRPGARTSALGIPVGQPRHADRHGGATLHTGGGARDLRRADRGCGRARALHANLHRVRRSALCRLGGREHPHGGVPGFPAHGLVRAVQLERRTAVVAFAIAALSSVVAIRSNLDNATPTLGIPYWIFLGAAFVGLTMTTVECAVQFAKALPAAALRHLSAGARAGGGARPAGRAAPLSAGTDNGPHDHCRLRGPVPLRLPGGGRDRRAGDHLHPRGRHPAGACRSADDLCAGQLPARRRAGLHLRRQPDEPVGHHKRHLSLRPHDRRTRAGRARAGERHRLAHLLRRVRRRFGRHRRARPDRGPRHGAGGFSRAYAGAITCASAIVGPIFPPRYRSSSTGPSPPSRSCSSWSPGSCRLCSTSPS